MRGVPVPSACQTRTVLSSDTVAMRLLSGLHATHQTASGCGRMTRVSPLCSDPTLPPPRTLGERHHGQQIPLLSLADPQVSARPLLRPPAREPCSSVFRRAIPPEQPLRLFAPLPAQSSYRIMPMAQRSLRASMPSEINCS